MGCGIRRAARRRRCVCGGGATDRGRGSEEAPLCRWCVVRDTWCLGGVWDGWRHESEGTNLLCADVAYTLGAVAATGWELVPVGDYRAGDTL